MPTIKLNGLKHYYDDIGSGMEEVLVMLHGANGSAERFEKYHGELTKRFRVIAPDLRSMGRSEHVKTMPPSAWVDDLRALLDHLGIQQAHVWGNSLGSRVAMRFAIDHPTRARSVIVSAAHTYLTKELDQGQNRVGGDPQKLSPQDQAEMKRRHGEDWMDAYRNYYNIRNVVALQEYYNLRVSHPLSQVVYNFTEPVTKIKCPILVLTTDNISRGRGGFDHAMELKNELPDQVRLAVVPVFLPEPSLSGVGATGSASTFGDSASPPEFRQLVFKFADSLLPVAAGRR